MIEVEEIRDSLFAYRTADERDIAIADARVMRERSAGLLAMAGNEPELEFDIVNVELTPIPKPKPAVTGNQLGTLAAIAA